MNTPQTSAQQEADRAILRQRIAYDRSECSNEWLDSGQLVQELAAATERLQATQTPLRRAARCLLGCLVALAAGLVLVLTWRLLR